MADVGYPVAIVGAGPVGLTLANLLGRYGVRCVLLEQAATTSRQPRAQTIDDESMRTLQAIDCAHEFAEMILPAAGSNYYDEQRQLFAQVGVGPKNYGFFKRNYLLQQQLDALLYARLSRFSCVDLRFDTTVQGVRQRNDRVELDLGEHGTLSCRFLAACDGGQSMIRKSLGVTMQGWTYEQDWIVLDAIDDPDQEAVSRFFCDPARPCVSISVARRRPALRVYVVAAVSAQMRCLMINTWPICCKCFGLGTRVKLPGVRCTRFTPASLIVCEWIGFFCSAMLPT